MNDNIFDAFLFLTIGCLFVVVVGGTLFLLDSLCHYALGFSFLDRVEKFLFEKFGR